MRLIGYFGLGLALMACAKGGVSDDTGETGDSDSQSDSGDTDTDSGDTDSDPVYQLDEGKYLVEEAVTHPNDCNADFSDYQGRKWRVWPTESTVDIEALVHDRVGNDFNLVDSETRDWSGMGADCITRIDSVQTGTVDAENSFNWHWALTWTPVGGDGCTEALGYEGACSYEGDFRMTWAEDI
jgi:hypothetical protein